jgi:DNA invertase Pin-like site-specific DNA recombinase
MARKKTPLLIPVGRKSAKEDPKISRERQQRAIEGWAASAGVELAPFVFEAGMSGSKPWQERGLGEAIAACKRGEADGIVLEEQSRLSRENGLATAEVWNALQNDGDPIRLVLVADAIDTATGDHELNFSVRAALAREQWKQYRRRVEDAKRNAVARGVHVSAKVPVGYRRSGRGQPLVVDPATAPAITRAFELRASGATRRELVALLEELLPGGPMFASGRSKKRGSWTVETVGSLLRNRAYLGEASAGPKYVNPKGHTALVDQATFDTVQSLWARPEPRSLPGSAVALLGGLVRCASCHYMMTRGVSSRKRGREFVYYKCRGHSAAGPCPGRASAPAAELEELVEEAAWQRLRSRKIERSPSTVDVEAVHRKLAALRARLEQWSSPVVLEKVGMEAWQRGVDEVEAEIDAQQLELAGSVPAGGESTVELLVAGDRRPESVEDRREIIEAGVAAVIVSPAPRGTPLADRVEIYWHGDVLPFPLPTQGRPEVEAGVVAA